MIRHLAVLTLEHLLSGVDEEHQDIFEILTKTEEICYENEQTTTTREEEYDENIKFITGDDNVRGNSEITESHQRVNGEIDSNESKVVGTAKTTRKVNVKVLTRKGKRFVNNMMDHAQTTDLNELCFTERENYLGFRYPSINLFNVIDVKGAVYFNNDIKLYRKESGKLLSYPNYDIDNMDFYTDENGDILPFMSSQEFNDTWKMIMDASKIKDYKSSDVNTSLKKEDKTLNDVSVAYYNGKMCQLFGKAPNKNEKILAQCVQPEWNIPYNGFLTTVQEEPELSELALKLWLTAKIGSNASVNGDSKPKDGGKFDQLNQRQKKRNNNKGKKNNNSQPENNAKANANNPNNQGQDEAATTSDKK